MRNFSFLCFQNITVCLMGAEDYFVEMLGGCGFFLYFCRRLSMAP